MAVGRRKPNCKPCLTAETAGGSTDPMNYRHAYHAGNFADVIKHVILSRVLTYMTLKPQPFRVIDTHAGAGIYDLTGLEANKTGEWRDGIGRLIDADNHPPLPNCSRRISTPSPP